MIRQLGSLVFAALALGLVLTPLRASAQSAVTAQASVSAEQVRLGERFNLTVVVQHPADVLVNVDPPERSAVLHLAEIRPRSVTTGTSGSMTRFEYVLAAFELGGTQLPALRLSWLNADGVTGEDTVAIPPLTVISTSAPDDAELRPLKPQLEVAGAPPAWQRPAIAGAAVALIAAIAAAAWLRLRRRRVPVAEPVSDDIAVPEGDARRRLDALAASAPLERGDYDEYYGTIAVVVREYLHERFAFGAHALTTPELQQRMVSRGVERWQARLVGGLLDRCDGAVYAGRHPDPASADHDLTVAFEIIELSRPSAVAEPVESR
jgi:hypothetical protein